MKIAIVTGAVVLLSGFTGCVPNLDRHAALPPSLAKVPASLKIVCSQVVDIPDRDLTRDEIASLWAKDRAALGVCFRRHGALVRAVDALERQGK